MDRKKLLKHLVVLMFFIFIMNSLALRFYWYYSVWYFDIIMHSLSGFWVSLFFIYVFSMKDTGNPNFRFFFKVLVATLFVGIFWEFYEYFLNVVSFTFFDLWDTVFDIFFDLVGGLCAILYIWKKQQKKQLK